MFDRSSIFVVIDCTQWFKNRTSLFTSRTPVLRIREAPIPLADRQSACRSGALNMQKEKERKKGTTMGGLTNQRLVVVLLCSVCGIGSALSPTAATRRCWISKVTTTTTTTTAAVFFSPRLAVSSLPQRDGCISGCLRECTKIAPGEANTNYCVSNCEDYCKDDGQPKGEADVVRQDAS